MLAAFGSALAVHFPLRVTAFCSNGALTEDIIKRQFVPSIEAALNYFAGVNRQRLPEACPRDIFPSSW